MIARDDSELILRTGTALGNGMIEGVRSVAYIKPQSFDSANNCDIVPVLARLNADFAARGEGYVLIGPGRWGSRRIPRLAFPCAGPIFRRRAHHCGGLGRDYRIEPSQGNTLLQNLTSFGVGYFYCRPPRRQRILRYRVPRPAQPGRARRRVRAPVVTFERPLGVAINGRSRAGRDSKTRI